MFAYIAAIYLASLVSAWPAPQLSSRDLSSVCRDVDIPIPVSVPRFILNTTVENDWDAAALTFNFTRRDFGTSSDSLPITGTTKAPVNSTFTIGATLCGTKGPVLILTHGIIESKSYWSPNISAQNDFIQAAIDAGYSVLNYDRIGVGSSSKISALVDAQFQVEVAVLDSLVAYAQTAFKSAKIALIGHSYGSYISAAAASQTSVDALVLTGFSGTVTYFDPFIAGSGFRVAKLWNPSRWGNLDSGYLMSSDLYAETYVYFKEPYFEHRVAEWAYEVASEPFAVGELPSLIATNITYADIKAPVLVAQGQYDVSACGGNCVGVVSSTTKALFTNTTAFEYVDDLPAGHNLNLHKIAPKAFEIIFDFLSRHGM